MDCDRVFNILTAGPFPTGSDFDEPVEQHLSVCLACRSLSEALRPAPELFHESLTPSENCALPTYHAMSLTSSVRQETSSQQEMRSHSTPATALRHNRSGNQYRSFSKDRWNNMVSSVEVGQRSEITTVLTFISLLAITMYSLGWIVQ